MSRWPWKLSLAARLSYVTGRTAWPPDPRCVSVRIEQLWVSAIPEAWKKTCGSHITVLSMNAFFGPTWCFVFLQLSVYKWKNGHNTQSHTHKMELGEGHSAWSAVGPASHWYADVGPLSPTFVAAAQQQKGWERHGWLSAPNSRRDHPRSFQGPAKSFQKVVEIPDRWNSMTNHICDFFIVIHVHLYWRVINLHCTQIIL